jgi:hypothetical protein
MSVAIVLSHAFLVRSAAVLLGLSLLVLVINMAKILSHLFLCHEYACS